MSKLDAQLMANWMADLHGVIVDNAKMLTDLDRQIGDADHGSNMARGMKAVAALDAGSFDSAAAYLKKVGMTLVSTVGGAAGPLYGTFLLRFASALPADGELTANQFVVALSAGIDGVKARGKAEEGDKTLVDTLEPALRAFEEAASGGSDLADSLSAAASAAAEGRDATIPLIARKGRASYLGDRSRDHQDPGATSMAMVIESAARTLS